LNGPKTRSCSQVLLPGLSVRDAVSFEYPLPHG
jgi:hypothetical protein